MQVCANRVANQSVSRPFHSYLACLPRCTRTKHANLPGWNDYEIVFPVLVGLFYLGDRVLGERLVQWQTGRNVL